MSVNHGWRREPSSCGTAIAWFACVLHPRASPACGDCALWLCPWVPTVWFQMLPPPCAGCVTPQRASPLCVHTQLTERIPWQIPEQCQQVGGLEDTSTCPVRAMLPLGAIQVDSTAWPGPRSPQGSGVPTSCSNHGESRSGSASCYPVPSNRSKALGFKPLQTSIEPMCLQFPVHGSPPRVHTQQDRQICIL